MDMPITGGIPEPDAAAMREARARWDAVAKPLGSLGRFETLLVQIAGIQRTAEVRLSPRCCLVFCGDHGVTEEGVSQTGSGVTAKVARSVCEGTSNVSLMAAGTDVFAVDMGMARRVDHPALICRRIAAGTRNMTRGPAMTAEQAARALEAGIGLAREMKDRGYRLLAAGEMGIGNTTAAAAAASALLGRPPEALTGRGAGLSDEGLVRKQAAVRRALEVNRPDAGNALDVLAKVGGFELLGMAGLFIGGAACGLPVVIDGAISAVSALAAARLSPEARAYMLPSHRSREPLMRAVTEALGLEPVIDAGMALGEGTGAVMLFPLLDMALRVYAGEHTFAALGMEAYRPMGGGA